MNFAFSILCHLIHLQNRLFQSVLVFFSFSLCFDIVFGVFLFLEVKMVFCFWFYFQSYDGMGLRLDFIRMKQINREGNLDIYMCVYIGDLRWKGSNYLNDYHLVEQMAISYNIDLVRKANTRNSNTVIYVFLQYTYEQSIRNTVFTVGREFSVWHFLKIRFYIVEDSFICFGFSCFFANELHRRNNLFNQNISRVIEIKREEV